MTADFHPFDMAFLGRVATRIINEVKGVNGVVYDVTSKPPGRSSGSRGIGGNSVDLTLRLPANPISRPSDFLRLLSALHLTS